MTSLLLSYRGYRFPPDIISYAVRLYHRFCLSFRDAEDLLGHCQVDVERTGSVADETMTQTSDSDTRRLTPDAEGLCAE
jgi:transposase-like protein